MHFNRLNQILLFNNFNNKNIQNKISLESLKNVKRSLKLKFLKEGQNSMPFKNSVEEGGGNHMERLKYVEPDEADNFTKRLFKRVGMVPNLYCMMANSPMAFDGFLKLNASLEGAKLEKRYREMIYLATSSINGCNYCQASHTATSVEGGILTLEETIQARRLESPDPRANALLLFSREVIEKRGKVSDETLNALRDHGFTDEEIVEALGTISMATFSNYVANVGRPELDYLDAPPVD
ncbi:MAG: carboxymuconolactone decarboxylase family protein [Candidatus Bathyarchaeia archaeon]